MELPAQDDHYVARPMMMIAAREHGCRLVPHNAAEQLLAISAGTTSAIAVLLPALRIHAPIGSEAALGRCSAFVGKATGAVLGDIATRSLLHQLIRLFLGDLSSADPLLKTVTFKNLVRIEIDTGVWITGYDVVGCVVHVNLFRL